MAGERGSIILVSSHVARGAVGNRAMGFALERLGFAVWEVPTVILPYHPGHGRAERIVPDDQAFARLLAALADRPLADVAAVISGYLASPAQADAVARLVGAVKAVRPAALYVCDPVIGDAGGLYVAEEVAVGLRDRLVPLADLATPNAFELAWLAGLPEGGADLSPLVAATRRLGPPRVVVSSAPPLMRGHTACLMVAEDEVVLVEHRRAEGEVRGAGDLLAALLAARLLDGCAPAEALRLATASVVELVQLSAQAGGELTLAAGQEAIVRPRAAVGLRRLAAPR